MTGDATERLERGQRRAARRAAQPGRVGLSTLAFSADARWLATGGGGDAQVVDTAAWKPARAVGSRPEPQLRPARGAPRGRHGRGRRGGVDGRRRLGSPYTCAGPARVSTASPGRRTASCCRREPRRRRTGLRGGVGLRCAARATTSAGGSVRSSSMRRRSSCSPPARTGLSSWRTPLSGPARGARRPQKRGHGGATSTRTRARRGRVVRTAPRASGRDAVVPPVELATGQRECGVTTSLEPDDASSPSAARDTARASGTTSRDLLLAELPGMPPIDGGVSASCAPGRLRSRGPRRHRRARRRRVSSCRRHAASHGQPRAK